MTTINEKLFDYIYYSVGSEGGDGDLALVLIEQDHRVIAAEFEMYLARQPYGNWSRNDLENGDIVFGRDQESFVIANHDHFCSFLDGRSGNGYPEGKTPCTQKVVVS